MTDLGQYLWIAWRTLAVLERGMFFWIRRLISRAFSGRLYENLFRRAFEMLEEGRTQPSFHFPLWPTIPITSVLGSSPTLSFLAASLRVSRLVDQINKIFSKSIVSPSLGLEQAAAQRLDS